MKPRPKREPGRDERPPPAKPTTKRPAARPGVETTERVDPRTERR